MRQKKTEYCTIVHENKKTHDNKFFLIRNLPYFFLWKDISGIFDFEHYTENDKLRILFLIYKRRKC